jgi:CRISPR-associated protein Cas1
VATQDAQLRIKIIKSILKGKLINSRVMAMRILRALEKRSDGNLTHLSQQCNRITKALNAIDNTDNEDVLRGLEGTAAKAYFSILKAGLNWQGEHPFTKRTKRPPKDPINVLLSLGYTLCGDALFTACEVVGLDPYCGFFHAEKYGRPALALDLIEEFRSIIVDSVVLSLINKKMIKPKDFENDQHNGNRIILRNKGLKTFLHEYNKRLSTKIFHPFIGRSLAYRKCFEIQARQLRKIIEGCQSEYVPLKVR